MSELCCVCGADGIDAAGGLHCGGGHFVCSEACLGPLTLFALSPQQIRRQRGAISCPWRGAVVRGAPEICASPPWTLEAVTPHLDHETATRCAAAMRDMVATLLAVEAGLIGGRGPPEAPVPANAAPEAVEARVAVHRRAIVEHILTLHCPRCRAAFDNFVGCDALTCATCGGGFCAICLTAQANAHTHLSAARYHGADGFFGGRERFDRHHKARRVRLTADFIAGLDEPPAVKLAVLGAMQADLADLGISRVVDVEPLLPPERMRAGSQPPAPLPAGVGGELGVAEGGLPGPAALPAAAAAFRAAQAPAAPPAAAAVAAAQAAAAPGGAAADGIDVDELLDLAQPLIRALGAQRLHIPWGAVVVALVLVLPLLALVALLQPLLWPLMRLLVWLPLRPEHHRIARLARVPLRVAWHVLRRALIIGLRVRAQERIEARGCIARSRRACKRSVRMLWWASLVVLLSVTAYSLSACTGDAVLVLRGAWGLAVAAAQVGRLLVGAAVTVAIHLCGAVALFVSALLEALRSSVVVIGGAALAGATELSQPALALAISVTKALCSLRLARVSWIFGPMGWVVLCATVVVALRAPQAASALLLLFVVGLRSAARILWLVCWALDFAVWGAAKFCMLRAAWAFARDPE